MDKQKTRSSHRLGIIFDLRQLVVFSEVAKQKSFSKAAQQLDLAQASVSERISTLESALGVLLFNRLGRRVETTAAGEVLFEKAQQFIALHRETTASLDELDGLCRGDIVAGASTTPGEYILPELLKSFQSAHPQIVTRFAIDDSDSVIRRVESGELEFGIVGSRESNDHLTFRSFLKDHIVPVVASNHPLASHKTPISFDILKKEPMIWREAGSGTRAIVTQKLAKKARGKKEITGTVTELGSTTAVKEGVRHQLGLAFISRRAVAAETARGLLVELEVEGLKIERKFYIVQDRRRRLSPAATALIEHLKAVTTSNE